MLSAVRTTHLQENPMKRTDLAKNAGLKLDNAMRRTGTPDRFGAAANAATARREQRRLDQEKGLIPFAVKLNGELIKQIHAQAEANQTDLNETVAALLAKGLAA